MAIPQRNARFPGTYFVSSRTWESRALFLKEPACRIFVDTLLHYREERNYLLHAFALMPDHFHVLLTPDATKTLERTVQLIKGGSAHRIGKELDFRFPVWQRGFSDHRIRNAADYVSHVEYINLNPLKKKLADRPGEYPWSSASGQFELDKTPQGLKPPKDM